MVKGSCMFMEEFLLATWLFFFVICDKLYEPHHSYRAEGRVIFHQHVSDASYVHSGIVWYHVVSVFSMCIQYTYIYI